MRRKWQIRFCYLSDYKNPDIKDVKWYDSGRAYRLERTARRRWWLLVNQPAVVPKIYVVDKLPRRS